MSLLNLTADSFDATLASGKTLVDFWAGWCQPCRMLGPVIAELAEKYEGTVQVGKVDVEKENALAARFKVMSIPTVILFIDGKEAKRFVGVQPIETYEAEMR